MNLLESLTTRLQLVSLTFEKIDTEMIDQEIIKQTNTKELESHTDENGRFIVEFKN